MYRGMAELTKRMRQVEEAHGGRPIAEILADAYTTRGSITAAADSLGVSPSIFWQWLRIFGVRTKVVAELPPSD